MENNIPFTPIFSTKNGIEMEWKRKEKKSSGNKVNRNGIELEWKWVGKLSTEKDNVKWMKIE